MSVRESRALSAYINSEFDFLSDDEMNLNNLNGETTNQATSDPQSESSPEGVNGHNAETLEIIYESDISQRNSDDSVSDVNDTSADHPSTAKDIDSGSTSTVGPDSDVGQNLSNTPRLTSNPINDQAVFMRGRKLTGSEAGASVLLDDVESECAEGELARQKNERLCSVDSGLELNEQTDSSTCNSLQVDAPVRDAGRILSTSLTDLEEKPIKSVIYDESFRNSRWIFVKEEESDSLEDSDANSDCCKNGNDSSDFGSTYKDDDLAFSAKDDDLVSMARDGDLVSTTKVGDLVCVTEDGDLASAANDAKTISTAKDGDLISMAQDGGSVTTTKVGNLALLTECGDSAFAAKDGETISTANNDDIASTADDGDLSSAAEDLNDSVSAVKNDGDSVISTNSDTGYTYRRSYKELSIKRVQRQNSQQRFARVNTSEVSAEKEVKLTKTENDDGFGIHIIGDHPTTISQVVPGGVSERAGIEVGHVILAINYESVLHLNHSEIAARLVNNKSESVTLELCRQSSFTLMRNQHDNLDDQLYSSHMFKLINSAFNIWKRRWFVLKSDNCLYYYKNKEDKEILGAVPLAGYIIQRATDLRRPKDFSLKLMHPTKTYYFAANNEDELTKWAQLLNEATKSESTMDSWINASSHNVGLPALSIHNVDCNGFLHKMGGHYKAWKKRYCILKDGCLYYYTDIDSRSAQGVAHLHGYTTNPNPVSNKKNAFDLVPPESRMRTFHFFAETEFDKERWIRRMTLSISRWVQVT